MCKIFRFNTKDPSTASFYHAMHELFEAVGESTTYEAVFLIEPVAPCNQECEVGGERWFVTHTSQQLQAEFGIIRKNNCLIWKNGGTLQCGKAELFACAQRVSQDNGVILLLCRPQLRKIGQ